MSAAFVEASPVKSRPATGRLQEMEVRFLSQPGMNAATAARPGRGIAFTDGRILERSGDGVHRTALEGERDALTKADLGTTSRLENRVVALPRRSAIRVGRSTSGSSGRQRPKLASLEVASSAYAPRRSSTGRGKALT